MERKRFAHAEAFGGYNSYSVVLTRYGRELFQSQLVPQVNSGSVSRSNRYRAIAEAQDWAEAHGYAGLVWS
jgi:hypothetical protein